jgi:hypothetical protein
VVQNCINSFIFEGFVPTSQHPNTTLFEDWHGFQPDISHLHSFSYTAYAKIPVEVDGGKLVPCSIKCVLIGYFGCDAYRLLNKSTDKMYRSQDVIGHHTISAPPVLDEGRLTMSSFYLPVTLKLPLTLALFLLTQLLNLLLNNQLHKILNLYLSDD